MKKVERMNAKEIADLLQIPVVKVQRWVHQGRIPCKFKGFHYSFKRKEIIDWAKTHGFYIPEKDEPDIKGEAEDSFSLRKSIEKGGVFFNLEGSDIVDVLAHAVELMTLPPSYDKAFVLNELLSREEIASTGIGKGVAIPHPRCTLNLGDESAMIPVFFLKEPVDFNAVDGDSVSILFVMLSPSTEAHLKLLSRISFLLRDKEFLSELKNCRTGNDVLLLIGEREKKLSV